MKNIKRILILLVTVLIYSSVQGQVGAYYRNVQLKYATTITKTDDVSITTQDDDLTKVYWFNETGICYAVYMQWEDLPKSEYARMLNRNETLTTSKDGTFWYNYNLADNGKTYYTTTRLERDDSGGTYLVIKLGKKTMNDD